ncbi:hypothetical protein P7K49_033934 [Saguinus oedipus]|uniref:Uncharacterized protein n=1 Tax=Saguinus oedipus TaxID=9490 RepID=A0ABQ9TV46_SAGOE|nr:hypothetical protein P7K49_033934 [Saguinus oedipus]
MQPAPAASSAGASAGPGAELTGPAAREIARIPVPYQQAPGAPVRESTFQLGERKRESERTDSEAGSWVIRLGGSHAHGDKQGSDWRRLGLRVLLPAFRTVQPGQGGASTIAEEVHPHLSTAQD